MVKNIRIADMNSYIAAFEPEPVQEDTRAALRKSAELPQVEDVKEITEPEEVKEEIPVEPVKATRKKTTKK